MKEKSMSLRRQQSKFAKALGSLLCYAYLSGYEITLGDTYPGKFKHRLNGAHPKGLAIDINLFINDIYMEDTLSHTLLGKYWKTLGGIWGGDFKKPDGNHYEWPRK